MTILTYLRYLILHGFSLQREERDESFPLVMAGGVTTFLNPEPVSDFLIFSSWEKPRKTLMRLLICSRLSFIATIQSRKYLKNW